MAAAPTSDHEGPVPVQVLFARQAIMDAEGKVRGYELLFRGKRDEAGEVPDAEHATCQVLAAAFAEVGLETAVGKHRAWINVSERFLFEFDPLPFPPHGTVLELLEDHKPSFELILRLKDLRKAGYQIALDDFILDESNHAMLEVADFVKVDLRAGERREVEPMIRRLVARGKKVLAEKVEDHDEHSWALNAGATLFQGFYFCRPEHVEGVSPQAASVGRLRAAAELADADAGFEAEELALKTDPELSLRLLRYLNSAALSLPHRIVSVRHAMTMLGLRTVRQWALVLLMGGIDEQKGPLLPTALIRARTCELIAIENGAAEPDAYFSVGLLSISDALAGRPMQEVLDELPLDRKICAALIDREGPMGTALEAAITCERGQVPRGSSASALAAYADAVTWAEAQGVY